MRTSRLRSGGVVLAGFACSASVFAAAGAEEGRFQPILAETATSKGRETTLRVTTFKVNPDVYSRHAPRTMFVTAPTLQAMAEARFAEDQAEQERVVREEGWSFFNLAFGGAGSVSTLAEGAAKLGGLSNINSAFTQLGLFMTVWQVSLDLSKGDNRSAGINAYKGLLGYAVGNWGWPMLQVSAVAFYAVDVTLQTFGTEAWAARTDAWRQAYAAYYREGDAAARQGELGPQSGYLKPTIESQISEIRERGEGGRSINEWKILLTYYYLKATSAERFKALLDAELDLYVSKFWRSPRLEEYAAEAGRGQAGLARGASLTDEIKRKLEDEHKARLMAMIVRDILPEIAHQAWIKALEAQVAKLNETLKPDLNSPLLIELSSYDLAEPARFRVPLPAGGGWAGTLEPGKSRTIAMTKLAYLKAGLPDTIELETSSGVQERQFSFTENKATVTFGTPRAYLVSAFNRRETDATCQITRRLKDGTTETATKTRPAPPPDVVHYAMPMPGQLLFGRYQASSGWTVASPGTVPQDGGRIELATPRFDDISAISQCSSGVLKGDMLADATCTAERLIVSLADGTETTSVCTSSITLSLKGAYMPQGGTMQYFPLDGEQGRVLRDALRGAIKHSGATQE